MKKIYVTLMALAAALMLVPTASAQTDDEHEKYVAYPTKGVGLNKYLKDTEPNADGEYTLRLETFLTGSVNTTAIPTDFVLVLDCSGSMLFDALFGKARPESVTATQMQDPNNQYYNFLRPAHTEENVFGDLIHYSANRAFNTGNIGTQMESSGNGRTAWGYFGAVSSIETPSLYYLYNGTYYKIHYETVSSHYYLYFTAAEGKRWLRCTQSGGTITTTVVNTRPTGSTANDNDHDILLIGYAGDNIYRPIQRREALVDGVNTFIEEIYDHNTKDNFAPGVTKNQVSIVAFGDGFSSGDSWSTAAPNISENSTVGSGTRVVKSFKEITSSNKDTYKSALNDYFAFRGNTYIAYGMRLAKRLLQVKQTEPGMAPLNAQGGINRNKVVVVFTDGVPSNLSSSGTTSGTTNAYNNVNLALGEARTIKTVRTSPTGTQINAKIFSLDLSGDADAKKFLQRLSSNYPDGSATGGTTIGTITYGGTAINPASDRIFYMDVNEEGGLEKAFSAIVDANTGNTSAHMVAVDALSDSFDLPEGVETSGKVKLFTAQCVGIKTIDGETFLAFTDDVPVDSRGEIEEIWYNSTNENNETVWTKQTNIDIDADIDYYINEETKSIIFTGFDFGNLWCGIDNDPNHHNTQQITSGMKNYDVRDPQYRGFKLIAEFPIILSENAVGGPNVPTNKHDDSGLFPSDDGTTPGTSPIVNYPEPKLPIPIRMTIQKTGLKPGESASFTIERRDASQDDSTYEEFTTFVLTGNATATDIPEVRIINLDPRYHYRVKETGWSWAYENADPTAYPSTEDLTLGNPIVFENTPETDTPKHAEAKAVNKMRSTGSQTVTVYDKTE